MTRAGCYFLCLWIGAVLFTGTGAVQAAEFKVQVNARGLVTFNAGTGRTPLTQILTRLSQNACVHIFLPGQVPAESMAGSFQNIPIEEAVARLLGPASFAVVYPGGTGFTGSLSLYTDDTIQNTGTNQFSQADMDGAAAGRGRHRPKSSGRIAHQTAPGSLNPEFDRGHTNQGAKRTEHGKTRATASAEPFTGSSGTTSGSGTTPVSGTAAANAAAQAGNSGTQDHSKKCDRDPFRNRFRRHRFNRPSDRKAQIPDRKADPRDRQRQGRPIPGNMDRCKRQKLRL